MIDVEVRGRFGQYIKAVLCNVVNDEAVVSYPQSHLEERVRLTEVRLPPSGIGNVSAGQGAEVLFSVQETPGGQSVDGNLSGVAPEDSSSHSGLSSSSCKVNHLELPAWWPCHVQRVRDEVAVVKLDVKPMSSASAADQAVCSQLSTITDIVNRASLRQLVTDTSHLTSDTILRHCIEIPKELADFASDTAVHAEFVKHCGGPTSLFYDAEAGCLVVLSTDKDTIDNVVLLEDTHLKMLRQKWAITRSLRQTMRSLEVNRTADGVRSTVAHSRSSGDWDSDPSVVVEKFYVPQRLMGLAIGSHGANIRAAREIPGVISIRVRETPGPGWRGGSTGVEPLGDSGDSALIIVEAKNVEAAKQARAKLEFIDLYLGVPQRYVARLIGKRTANILSVVDKSGVVSIHLDNQTQCPSDDEEVLNIGHLNLNYPGSPSSDMRRIFLRRPDPHPTDNAGGSQAVTQPPTDERYCGFILSGTRESVEKARLLINFQLDYIYDLEKLEADNMEIMRSLGSDANAGHPTRGYPDGPGRWGGGRGLSRGGRRPPGRGAANHPQNTTVDNSFNSNHPSERDNAGSYPPYPTNRRPPRGGSRPYNGDSRGRRGRGSTRVPREYHDWHDQTGSNGDVIDRRRGSEDSDQMGGYSVTDDERAETQYGPNEHRRKRSDQSAPTTGPEMDDGYRASDESGPGENGVQPNGGPGSKGSTNSSRQRGEYERGGHGSRPPRGRRTDRHRGAIPAPRPYV